MKRFMYWVICFVLVFCKHANAMKTEKNCCFPFLISKKKYPHGPSGYIPIGQDPKEDQKRAGNIFCKTKEENANEKKKFDKTVAKKSYNNTTDMFKLISSPSGLRLP